MLEYHIRSVEKNDHQQVIALLQSISEYSPDTVMCNEIWKTFIKQQHLIAVVAVAKMNMDACNVIGYGSVCMEFKIRGGTMGHIEDVVVDASYHGHGIGSAIVKHLVVSAKAAGCYKVSLECRAEKVPFYAQLGFQSTGQAMSSLLI